MLTVDNLLEAADCVLQLDILARAPGELLGDVKRLRKEPLDTACSSNSLLVFVTQFVDAENGDDVLQIFVALQDLLNALRNAIVLVTHDVRIKNARRRSQRIDGGINTDFRQRARKHRRRVKVSEGRRRSRIRQVVGGHVNRLHRRD